MNKEQPSGNHDENTGFSWAEEGASKFSLTVEDQLRTLPVERIVWCKRGSNKNYWVDLLGGVRAFFKPGKGENPLPDFPYTNNKLYQREVAAYLVDTALGFGLVPPTVLRDIPKKGEGSLQSEVIEIDPNTPVMEEKTYRRDMYALALFDYIIWNKDRMNDNVNGKNILAGTIVSNAKPQMYAIDNGLSFEPWGQYMISYNLETYVFGKKPPNDIRECVQSFLNDPGAPTDLRKRLLKLVPSNTIDALFSRIKHVDALFEANGIIQWSDIIISAGMREWMNNIYHFPSR